MRFQSPADLNAYHRAFYVAQAKQMDYLLEREYIRQFVMQKFVAQPMRDVDLFPIDAYQRLRHEPSFESQVINYAKSPDATGTLARKIRYGREPRRKAAGDGLSRRQIIAQFALEPANSVMRTKSLWQPFFDELVRLHLNPSKISNGGSYEYNGKRGRLNVTYRQFEKLVSELAPRRTQRLSA